MKTKMLLIQSKNGVTIVKKIFRKDGWVEHAMRLTTEQFEDISQQYAENN